MGARKAGSRRSKRRSAMGCALQANPAQSRDDAALDAFFRTKGNDEIDGGERLDLDVVHGFLARATGGGHSRSRWNARTGSLFGLYPRQRQIGFARS